jgi:hypothetical protein
VKKIVVPILAILLILISGCAPKPTAPIQPNIPTQLTLSFETNPAKPVPNQPVTLMTKVTSNNKAVDNADVEFEIWKKEEKNHQMIKAKRTGDGLYTISTKYPVSGIYNVIIHATTPQVHQMISKTFTIGQVPKDQHEHHSATADLLLHLQLPATAKSGQETKLIGHVAKNNEPFTGANVKFEVWKQDSNKHDYTEVTETKPGEYTSTYQFKTPGTYHVKLHVEKGSEHEHSEELLVVK